MFRRSRLAGLTGGRSASAPGHRGRPQELDPKGGLRFLAYSHDGMGLGHLRRNATIASALTRSIPGSTGLLVASTPAHALISLAEGVDLVKLPSIVKVDTGRWEARSLRVGRAELRHLRAELIGTAVAAFQPDLVLIDYLPTGVWGELVPTLEALRREEPTPHIVLGLRDILDSPTVTRALLKRERSYEALQKYFDAVWIYGRAGDFDTTAQYGLDSQVDIPVHHVGYLTADPTPGGREDMRGELGLTGEKLILVTAGGGYDAFPMMEATIEALRRLPGAASWFAVIVTGPLMPEADRMRLEKTAAGLPARFLGSTDSMPSFLHAADLVVTMGGYNTVMESLRMRKPTIVIPREGPSAEQVMRAELLHDMGIVRAERLDSSSSLQLAQVILEGMEGNLGPKRNLPFDGLRNVVGYVRSGLLELSASGVAE